MVLAANAAMETDIVMAMGTAAGCMRAPRASAAKAEGAKGKAMGAAASVLRLQRLFVRTMPRL